MSKLLGQKMISTSSIIDCNGERKFSSSACSTSPSRISSVRAKSNEDYIRAIHDLNLLQSNTQAVALAKYKDPQQILPLFERQLNSAGIRVDDLNRLNIIHISGTKGKGSTCAFLERILRGEGLKTGFYNSPHLIKVNERIKLNGQQIDESKFSKHFRHIYDRLQEAAKKDHALLPSYFSFLTILAYHIFLEERVDCAIIEVGIGGQYDPTNIVKKPVACGITSIHYDHINILGDTIESIARSKAGIAKPGVPIFTVEQEHKSALDVIRAKAIESKCPLIICRSIDHIQNDIALGIRGIAQYQNAALACQLGYYFLSSEKHKKRLTHHEETLEIDLNMMPASFRNSLAICSWPGRCQIVRYPTTEFYLDGAHTKESMENCLDWFLSEVGEVRENEMRILMVNIIGDRNKYEILKPLACGNHFDRIIFSTNRINYSGDTPKSETFVNMQTPNSDRSLENAITNAKIWTSLAGEKDNSRREVKSNLADSLEFISDTIRLNPDKSVKILVTGSLHFVGAVLEILPVFDEAFNRINCLK